MTDFLAQLANYMRTWGQFEIAPNFTVLKLLFLLFGLVLVVVIEGAVRRYLIVRVLRRTHLTPSLQFAIARILGYVLLGLGFYCAFITAGLNLSSLAIIAGGAGVGLGFGLQNVVSNFVSGIIILAERPISIGDRVEIGSVAGQVQAINLRSTTVLTNDNIAIIVPNAQFISEKVTNWNYGDPKVRFRIPISVAYGTDIQLLTETLLEVARENPNALAQPPAKVFFIGFGDSSLNFELGIWTEELTHSPRRFRSDLNFAIEKKFRQRGIQIPFPQHEVRILTSPNSP